jgi:hypothetical protein
LLPCYLVPSGRVRPLVTVLTMFLHFSLSLTASFSSCNERPVSSLISSSHLILGLPLSLFPPPMPIITAFSSPSPLITCSKYFSFRSAICSDIIVLIPNCSRIDAFVLLAVHAIRSNLLQHQFSNDLLCLCLSSSSSMSRIRT